MEHKLTRKELEAEIKEIETIAESYRLNLSKMELTLELYKSKLKELK